MNEEIYDLSLLSPCSFREAQVYAFMVGVDKVHAEVVLNFRSVTHQIKNRGDWRRWDGTTKETRYFLDRGNKKSKQVLRWRLYKRWRNKPKDQPQIPGKRAGFEWILGVQFNPSYWMPELSVLGAQKGFNYLAANSAALRLVFDEIEACLASPEFAHLKPLASANANGEKFTTDQLSLGCFSLNRVDLARDIHFRTSKGYDRAQYATQAEWEEEVAFDFLQLFVGLAPSYIPRYNPLKSTQRHAFAAYLHFEQEKLKKATSTKDFLAQQKLIAELEKQTMPGFNPLSAPYDYLSNHIEARRTVFYLKRRFDPNPEPHLVGAPIRFEHRLTRRKEIQLCLKTVTFQGLQDLLQNSDEWHRKSRRSAVPVLEQVLNEQMARWHQASGALYDVGAEVDRVLEQQARAGKLGQGYLKPNSDFRSFLLTLEEAHAAMQRTLFTSIGETALLPSIAADSLYISNRIKRDVMPRYFMEEAVVIGIESDLMIYMVNLTPVNFYRIAGRVTGYLDTANRPVSKKRMRYLRLRGMIDFILFVHRREGGYSHFKKLDAAIECCKMKKL